MMLGLQDKDLGAKIEKEEKDLNKWLNIKIRSHNNIFKQFY